MTTSKLNSSDVQQLEMFILDVLRHDKMEQLPSILRLLNDDTCIGWRDAWPHAFTAAEVIPALSRLVADGSVEAIREQTTSNGSDVAFEAVVPDVVGVEAAQDDLWFLLTAQGRRSWQKWQPPT